MNVEKIERFFRGKKKKNSIMTQKIITENPTNVHNDNLQPQNEEPDILLTAFSEYRIIIKHIISIYNEFKNVEQLMAIFSSSYDLILRYHKTDRLHLFTLDVCKKIVELRYIVKKQNIEYYNILETYLDELMPLV
jgi:hypothetical protein